MGSQNISWSFAPPKELIMSHYRVVVFEVDNSETNQMTELANVDVYDDHKNDQEEKPTIGYQVVDNLSKLASVFYGQGPKAK
jgi:hypothetical protein